MEIQLDSNIIEPASTRRIRSSGLKRVNWIKQVLIIETFLFLY